MLHVSHARSIHQLPKRSLATPQRRLPKITPIEPHQIERDVACDSPIHHQRIELRHTFRQDDDSPSTIASRAASSPAIAFAS